MVKNRKSHFYLLVFCLWSGWRNKQQPVVKGLYFVIRNFLPIAEIQLVLSVCLSANLFQSCCQLHQPEEVQQKVYEVTWGRIVLSATLRLGSEHGEHSLLKWPGWGAVAVAPVWEQKYTDRSGGSGEPERLCLAQRLALGRTPRNNPRQNRTIPNPQINEGPLSKAFIPGVVACILYRGIFLWLLTWIVKKYREHHPASS